MGPDLRADQLDRLIDDAVEQAEASVTFVPDGYGGGAQRGLMFGNPKRREQDDEGEDD